MHFAPITLAFLLSLAFVDAIPNPPNNIPFRSATSPNQPFSPRLSHPPFVTRPRHPASQRQNTQRRPNDSILPSLTQRPSTPYLTLDHPQARRYHSNRAKDHYEEGLVHLQNSKVDDPHISHHGRMAAIQSRKRGDYHYERARLAGQILRHKQEAAGDPFVTTLPNLPVDHCLAEECYRANAKAYRDTARQQFPVDNRWRANLAFAKHHDKNAEKAAAFQRGEQAEHEI